MTILRLHLAICERRRIEDEIERLIALLDLLDGDPDLEPDNLDPSGFMWGGSEEGGPALSGC